MAWQWFLDFIPLFAIFSSVHFGCFIIIFVYYKILYLVYWKWFYSFPLRAIKFMDFLFNFIELPDRNDRTRMFNFIFRLILMRMG